MAVNLRFNYVPPTSGVQTFLDLGGGTARATMARGFERNMSTGLPARPRVGITPSMVAFVQAQALANTSRWSNLKQFADNEVAYGATVSGDSYTYCDALGLAYIGTGDQAYADRIAIVLDAFCTTANFLTWRVSDDSFFYRYLNRIARGLDWAYDGLTPTQRQTYATWLMDAADWVHPETNSSTTAYGRTLVSSNYYQGYLTTFDAALAAFGEDTGTTATSPGSGSNRPLYHAELILSNWTNAIVPVLEMGQGVLNSPGVSGGALGGIFREGTTYSWGLDVSALGHSFLAAGGDYAAAAEGSDFFRQQVLFQLHSACPGFDFYVPYGDQPRISSCPMFFYNRNNITSALSASGADSTLTAQVYKWLDLVGGVPIYGNGGYALADEFKFFDPTITPATDLSALPLSYYAPGPGYFIWRSSWTDTAAELLAFDCGQFGVDHREHAANNLKIWAGGGWLSGGANVYSYSGTQQQTSAYNCMLGPVDWNSSQYQYIGGGDADINGGEYVAAPSVAAGLVWWRGQASKAYGSDHYQSHPERDRTVSDWCRTVAYVVAKHTLVIVDQVAFESAYADETPVFYWHTKNDVSASYSGQSFRMETAAADHYGHAKVLLPATGVTIAHVNQNLGNAGALTSHATTITPTNAASYKMVTTIQLSSSTTAPYTVSAVDNGTTIAVTVDDKVVTIPLDESSTVTVA